MELIQDWKLFQNYFYTKKKTLSNDSTSDQKQSFYFILDSNHLSVIAAYSESRDLSDFIGATEAEVRSSFAESELYFYQKNEVDSWLKESSTLGNFFDQILYFQKKVPPTQSYKNLHIPQNHFLLRLIQSPWHHLFPTHYGIFICLNGDLLNSILITVHKNSVESFHVPDFGVLSADRKKISADVIRFLKEEYYIPIQGLFITQKQWNEWSSFRTPWEKIFNDFKNDSSIFSPIKWRFLLLLLAQKLFSPFSTLRASKKKK